MVFCNNVYETGGNIQKRCHNPYFSRWFSAIFEQEDKKEGKKGHNPYFSRWFSAI